MTLSEWSECPKCNFPALYTQFKQILDVTKCCPMCSKPLDSSQILKQVKVLEPGNSDEVGGLVA
jgi:WD repeat-containing protein 19